MDELALVLGIVTLAALERLPRWRAVASPLVRPYFVSDLVCLATGAVALGVLLREVAQQGTAGLALPWPAATVPFAVSAVAALVLYDLGAYLCHLALHRSSALWRLHEVHHSSAVLDWLATFRAHVLEHALRHAFSAVSLTVLGFPPAAVALAAATYVLWAMLNHANLDLPLRFLEPVLITPRLHRLHHVPASCERNLGTVLSLWDRARGTLLRDPAAARAPLGVPGRVGTYPQGWLAQLRAPFARRPAPAATGCEEIYKQA